MNEVSQISPLEVGGIIGVCIVLAQGLIGITKLLINKRLNGKKDDVSPLSCNRFPNEQKEQLRRLYDLHCTFDEDGVPLWFVPRSSLANQAKMVEILNSLSTGQENLVHAVEKLTEKIENIKD